MWTRFQEFPCIKTLELTCWSWSYLSNDMVLISLYVKRRNKDVCLFVNTKIGAVALIRKQCYLIIFGKGVGMLHLFKRGRLIK